MSFFIRFILLFVLIISSRVYVSAQEKTTSKDSTKTDVISSTSSQTHAVDPDNGNIKPEGQPSNSVDRKTNIDVEGPIRDWSNESGFTGYNSNKTLKMKKHKMHTKKHKKYHPHQKYHHKPKMRSPKF